MLRLPSGRLLQYYKNAVPQHEGFNEEVLQWMEQEASKIQLSEHGKCGGIILDEISIQVYESYVIWCKWRIQAGELQAGEYNIHMVMHRTECTASLSNACVGASIGLIRWPIN